MAELLAAFSYTPQQRWGPISPHGVGTALGFFLGAWLMARRAEPRGIPRPEVYNAVTWGALGAIIGARGFYVIGHLDSYASVVDMFKVWEGGLTMFGGFVGGLALGLGYLRRRKFHIPTALDAAAPGFVVGVLVGRIGDIAIADHLGRTTSLPFGYRIPNAPLAPGYGPPYYSPGVVVHHTAVYDLLGALVLLGFLYWLERRRPRAGTLFAAFSIWYGLQRFVIDFTRNRLIIESSYFGLSGSQWAGLAFAAVGLYWVIRSSRRAEPVPAGATLGGTEAEIAAVGGDATPPAVTAPPTPPTDEATARPPLPPTDPPPPVPVSPEPPEAASTPAGPEAASAEQETTPAQTQEPAPQREAAAPEAPPPSVPPPPVSPPPPSPAEPDAAPTSASDADRAEPPAPPSPGSPQPGG